jgi:hypothetical protein
MEGSGISTGSSAADSASSNANATAQAALLQFLSNAAATSQNAGTQTSGTTIDANA